MKFVYNSIENISGKRENASQPFTSYVSFRLFQINSKWRYDVKNMDRNAYSYLIEKKTLWEKEKLLVTSNFFFSHNVFKSCLLLMRQNEYLWSKGLRWFSSFPKLLSKAFFLWIMKTCDCLVKTFNSLQQDKILDLSKLKAFADDKINLT